MASKLRACAILFLVHRNGADGSPPHVHDHEKSWLSPSRLSRCQSRPNIALISKSGSNPPM
jgi:hypothetical protein